MDYILSSNDELTHLVKERDITSWNQLTAFIRNLPYGRNANRSDLSLVLSEEKGTCSSKHALLKQIADLNNIPDIKLILGMYRMNQQNTPKIGTALSEHSIDFIPEAHCYLKIKGERIDFTARGSEFQRLEASIIQELEIEPWQVSDFKVDYHKSFIKQWLKDTDSSFTFDQVWQIRERCIASLSE